MARYSVEVIDRRKSDGFAYVNDAKTGDVAKAFTGPSAITDAEQWAAHQEWITDRGHFEDTCEAISRHIDTRHAERN